MLKIYQSRKKIYGLANFKINCDNIDKTKIVKKKYWIFMKINRLKAKDYSIIIGKNSMTSLASEVKNLCPKCKKIAVIIDKKIPKNF